MGESIYLINSSNNDEYIIYLPLKRIVFKVNEKYASEIKKCLENKVKISDKYKDLKERMEIISNKNSLEIKQRTFRIQNQVVFILSQLCNMNCKYCYAQEAHSCEIISKEVIEKAIDCIMSNKSKYKKRISFIGGGEPTVTWDLLEYTVAYAEKRASEKNISLEFSMTTNGTLLDSKRAKWLKSHNFRISISYEILPQIQQKQRPLKAFEKNSFIEVDRGIKTLIQNGIVPAFRSTITRENADKMVDMVNYVIENYPEVKILHFEHVSDIALKDKSYYDIFLNNFFEALAIADKNGLILKNSITHSMNYIRSGFCTGEFCVTPTGEFVSCHRVSSERDKFYNKFKFGSLNMNFQEINSISKVLQTVLPDRNACNDCFAKFHCAGGCAYNREIYSEDQLNILCNFTRAMIARNLEYKLEKTMR